jgi:hypothetical protein
MHIKYIYIHQDLTVHTHAWRDLFYCVVIGVHEYVQQYSTVSTDCPSRA